MLKTFLLTLCVLGVLAAPAFAQTNLSKTLQVTLPAEFEHMPLRGIDSIVGKFAKKKGTLVITYDIGRVPKADGFRLGGDFVNQAERSNPQNREWLKHQTIGGQPVAVAYFKQNQLIVSFPRLGVNFVTTARTPEEIAEVLLIALSVQERQDKK